MILSLGVSLVLISPAESAVAQTSALAPMKPAEHTGGSILAGTNHTRHWYQLGQASWYGGKGWQGHKTASGEVFDMQMFTCAHRTLPIGTLLRVTNLLNSHTVIVRVNDRGPVAKNRVVDLSRAAANNLGILSSGTAKVRIERIENMELATAELIQQLPAPMILDDKSLLTQ